MKAFRKVEGRSKKISSSVSLFLLLKSKRFYFRKSGLLNDL